MSTEVAIRSDGKGVPRMVNDSTTAMADLPLHGVRVLEIASWIAGPACGRILREWGAEVVKVEPLWRRRSSWNGQSGSHPGRESPV